MPSKYTGGSPFSFKCLSHLLEPSGKIDGDVWCAGSIVLWIHHVTTDLLQVQLRIASGSRMASGSRSDVPVGQAMKRESKVIERKLNVRGKCVRVVDPPNTLVSVGE